MYDRMQTLTQTEIQLIHDSAMETLGSTGVAFNAAEALEITPESIDVEMVKAVGIGGQYLTQPKTFQLCRTEFYLSDMMNRQNHTGWAAAGGKRIDQVTAEMLGQRLAAYAKTGVGGGRREYACGLCGKTQGGLKDGRPQLGGHRGGGMDGGTFSLTGLRK
jgi:trimethylamine:corrinoid methyltransferase-like protein